MMSRTCFGASPGGRAGEQPGAGREITVAIENAYLPFNYILLETGEPGGWDYDFLAEACDRLNCEPVFVQFAWDPMITAVADGQFDMAADGITITAERAEVVDFSDPYVELVQRLLKRVADDRFADETAFRHPGRPIQANRGQEEVMHRVQQKSVFAIPSEL